MKKLLLLLVLSLPALAPAQDTAPKTSPGQACWGRSDRPSQANEDGLVCRDGVFRLASETNHWEEYRNIPAAKARSDNTIESKFPLVTLIDTPFSLKKFAKLLYFFACLYVSIYFWRETFSSNRRRVMWFAIAFVLMIGHGALILLFA